MRIFKPTSKFRVLQISVWSKSTVCVAMSEQVPHARDLFVAVETMKVHLKPKHCSSTCFSVLSAHHNLSLQPQIYYNVPNNAWCARKTNKDAWSTVKPCCSRKSGRSNELSVRTVWRDGCWYLSCCWLRNDICQAIHKNMFLPALLFPNTAQNILLVQITW